MNHNAIVNPHTQFFCRHWEQQVRLWNSTWINGPSDYGEALRFACVSFMHRRGENIRLDIARFGHN